MAHSPELQRFYGSKRWRDLRDMLVLQRHGVCDRCGKDYSTDTSHLVAHHKEHLTDENLMDLNVALNPDNIEIVCQKCHAHYHPDRGYLKRHKQVFIVYGPPLSGKTTYVAQNLEPGDLVVDLDRLRNAISFQPMYQTPPSLSQLTFSLRDYLYDQIRIRNGDWNTAWVVAGLPRKNERDRLAARLGASLVLIEASREECHKRLLDADDRPLEWGEYIDKWFRDYTA